MSKFKLSSSDRFIGENGIFNTSNRVSTLVMPAHAPSMVLPPKYDSRKKGLVKLSWKNAAGKTVYATKANTAKPAVYKRNVVKVDGKKQNIEVKGKVTIKRGKSKTLTVKGAKGQLLYVGKTADSWLGTSGTKCRKGVTLKQNKKGKLKIEVSKKAKRGSFKIIIWAYETEKYQPSPSKAIRITVK